MKKFVLITLISAIIVLSHKTHAWVEPKQGEEIPAPINTSSQGQTKKGILNINNWLKIISDPFSFEVGVEAPKFCIKKPDGSTSCCPPQAGQDWSACAGEGGGGLDAKWVWNTTTLGGRGLTGAYDLIVTNPEGNPDYINEMCTCKRQDSSTGSWSWLRSNTRVVTGPCVMTCYLNREPQYPGGP